MMSFAFLLAAAALLGWPLVYRRSRPSYAYEAIDAIVPAFNEEICITKTIEDLLWNAYINRVIAVNDGSTDGTAAVLDALAEKYKYLTVVHQPNTGKGGAIMTGLKHVEARYVLLTDADTEIPSRGHGLGYLLREIERGADAAGGIPASSLGGAGLLPHIRATVKIPMIALKRKVQQILGGAPFLISGACGLFKTEVLRAVPLSDRTNVEDLDLTWTLVEKGYKLRQSTRCIVYSQECNSLRSEWLRWRRWIIGYAVCMRLHPRLLLTRYGLFTILPMILLVFFGIGFFSCLIVVTVFDGQALQLPGMLFPILWIVVSCLIGTISAIHHRSFRLIPMAPLAVFYLFLSYVIWLTYGLAGLATGREPRRDKPERYASVVG
ncbi:glycosyltransferase family 2 protein [soil metagenome]|jgi:cellulose synthase/poly-beta-1,6-N-acetylglucosamine synthase-like glycosyltransferase